jgi:hypothetical protein
MCDAWNMRAVTSAIFLEQLRAKFSYCYQYLAIQFRIEPEIYMPQLNNRRDI